MSIDMIKFALYFNKQLIEKETHGRTMKFLMLRRTQLKDLLKEKM